MSGDKKTHEDGQAVAAEPIAGESHELDHFALRVVEIPQNKWLRRYRSVAFQMVVLALLAFSGPSMSNGKSFPGAKFVDLRTRVNITYLIAISSLGGGGQATPYTANTASATQYSTSILIA